MGPKPGFERMNASEENETTGKGERTRFSRSIRAWSMQCVEIGFLLMLFYAYAGDPPPGVNEAHYLVKAKNFWDSSWCSEDLFASSGKAHTTFYALFGWPTQYVSLETSAWIGRWAGWVLLAMGLQKLSWSIAPYRFWSLAVAIIWIAGMDYGDLAGEWVVGGIEAKVPAYAFVLFGLAGAVRRRWNSAWVWFGLASAFHVLTGGWSVIAALICYTMTERRRGKALRRLFSPGLFLGGGLALLGLVPAILLTSTASSAESAEAASIYVYTRISHHLTPAAFHWSWFVRHGILVAMMLVLTWGVRQRAARRLFRFGIGAVTIAAVGLLIGLIPALDPELAAKLLRYYWFRLTDSVVPLVVAGLVVERLTSTQESTQVSRFFACLLLGVSLLLCVHSAYTRGQLAVPPSASHQLLGIQSDASPERQRQTFSDWLAVCRWARLATPENEVFLTPRHQQSFKWYAERAEVVNWKDVPQDASSLIEWKKRFDEVFPSYEGSHRLGRIRVTIQYEKLKKFRQRYSVRFMIIDRRVFPAKNLPLLRVYPAEGETNQTYAVYELPQLSNNTGK